MTSSCGNLVALTRVGASHPSTSTVQRTANIHQVAVRLTSEFAPILPPDMVSSVVTAACGDLAREVPAESLAEFVYHAARQRLVDACGANEANEVGAGYRRRRIRGCAS